MLYIEVFTPKHRNIFDEDVYEAQLQKIQTCELDGGCGVYVLCVSRVHFSHGFLQLHLSFSLSPHRL